MTEIGIKIGASTSPVELCDIARKVNQLGFRELWLAEDC